MYLLFATRCGDSSKSTLKDDACLTELSPGIPNRNHADPTKNRIVIGVLLTRELSKFSLINP